MTKKICIECSKNFKAKKGQIGKFCSGNCYGKWLSKNQKDKNSPSWKGGKPICKDCGVKTKDYKSIRCLKCVLKFRKGENASHWKGGITPLIKKIRNSIEYKLWRESVFKRDNYTCIWCGKRGSELNADHIKRFADYPELRFAIDNGRTLCVLCHKTTDTWGGKK